MSEQGLNTVNFAGRAAASPQFKTLYSEGMGPVSYTHLTLPTILRV